LRLALHPGGMAPRIVNLAQWRAHVLTQLQRRTRALADRRLAQLHQELAGYPGGIDEPAPADGVVLPPRYRHNGTELALFSVTTAVSTATDVTVEELAIESFYPADASAAAALRAAEAGPSSAW
jgi:MmyB-like transcription regulator ligand binding domain